MKRGLKHIFTHLISATLVWGTLFYFVFSNRNQPVDPPAASQQPTSSNRPGFINGRDLRYYPRLELSTSYRTRSREQFSLLYRFLWLHWSHKDEGLAEVSFCGVDAGGTDYFFVEKDPNGDWVIAVDSQHFQAGSRKEYPFDRRATIYYVEKVELKDHGQLGDRLNPKAESEGRDFGLRFLDKDHKPVDLGLKW